MHNLRSGRHTVFAGSRKVVIPSTEALEVLRLWVIEYELINTGKGCAIVKALNAKKAEDILKHSGTYNGNPSKYSIIRIEEIICPPAEGLIAEQNVVCFEN